MSVAGGWRCPACRHLLPTRASCVAHLVEAEDWDAEDAVTWAASCAATQAACEGDVDVDACGDLGGIGNEEDAGSVRSNSVYTLASEGRAPFVPTRPKSIMSGRTSLPFIHGHALPVHPQPITPTASPRIAPQSLAAEESDIEETSTMKRSPGRHNTREKGECDADAAPIPSLISLVDLDEKIRKMVDDAMRRGGRLTPGPSADPPLNTARSNTAPLRSSLKPPPPPQKLVTIVSPPKWKMELQPIIPPRPFTPVTTPGMIFMQSTKSSPATVNFFEHAQQRPQFGRDLHALAPLHFPSMSRNNSARASLVRSVGPHDDDSVFEAHRQYPSLSRNGSTSTVIRRASTKESRQSRAKETLESLLYDTHRYVLELENAATHEETVDDRRSTKTSDKSSLNHLDMLIDEIMADVGDIAEPEGSCKFQRMEFADGKLKLPRAYETQPPLRPPSAPRASRLTARRSNRSNNVRSRSRLEPTILEDEIWAASATSQADDILRDLESFISQTSRRDDILDEGYGSSPTNTTNSFSVESADSDFKNRRRRTATLPRPVGVTAINNARARRAAPRFKPPPHITELPGVILRRIASHLHPHDVLRLQCLSKASASLFPNPRNDGTFSLLLLNNHIVSDGRAALATIRWDKLGVRPCAALITLLNLTPSTLSLLHPEFRSLTKPPPRPMPDISFIVEALAIALADDNGRRQNGFPRADPRASDFFALRWLAAVDEQMLLTKLLSCMRPRPPESLYSDILKVVVLHSPNVPLLHHLLPHSSKHAISTSFVSCAANNNTPTLSILLSHPLVNPLTQCNAAIRIACARGHVESVRCLLDDGRVDPFALHGEDLVGVAAGRGHGSVVRLLNGWLEAKGKKEGRMYGDKEMLVKWAGGVVVSQGEVYGGLDGAGTGAGKVSIGVSRTQSRNRRQELESSHSMRKQQPLTRAVPAAPASIPAPTVAAVNLPDDGRDEDWAREVERRNKRRGGVPNGDTVLITGYRDPGDASRRRREDLEWLRGVIERREADVPAIKVSAEEALRRRETENIGRVQDSGGRLPDVGDMSLARDGRRDDLGAERRVAAAAIGVDVAANRARRIAMNRAVEREMEREAEKRRERQREIEDAREVDRLREREWERHRGERTRRFGVQPVPGAGLRRQAAPGAFKVIGGGAGKDHWRTNIYAL